MKSCGSCGKRGVCVKVCAEVEASLPKEYTGRDSRREVGMTEAGMETVMDGHAFTAWSHAERVFTCPKLDLSVLTNKERKAVLLLASGMGYREAARYLKISLNALQSRVKSARARLLAGHYARLMEAQKLAGMIPAGGAE